LSQINPAYVLTLSFLRSISILASHLRLGNLNGPLVQSFQLKFCNFMYFSSTPCFLYTCPSHPILLNFIVLIILKNTSYEVFIM
jgi:hypothetical protein